MASKIKYLTKPQFWTVKVILWVFWPISFFVLGPRDWFRLARQFEGGYKKIEMEVPDGK